jgi:hypothetical protein
MYKDQISNMKVNTSSNNRNDNSRDQKSDPNKESDFEIESREIRKVSHLVGEIRIALLSLSKRRRKEVLNELASTDGWTISASIPVQAIARTVPSSQEQSSTRKRKLPRDERISKPPQKSAYKLTPEWIALDEQHNNVVMALKRTQSGTQENALLLSQLRAIEQNMKSFRTSNPG